MQNSTQPLKKPPLPAIWHERYHCPEAASFLSTTKQKKVVEEGVRRGLLDVRVDERFDEEATWREIAQIHAPAYVKAVRTGAPRTLAQSQGFVWSPGFAESVVRIWSGHVTACRLALRESLVFHPVSGAHHAMKGKGGGFCTFNYLVGAGRRLLKEGVVDRVMVVDLDTHQGNGVWELAGADPRFALFDISGSPFGVPEIDVERAFYRLVMNDDDYFEALSKLPVMLDRFRPNLIQFQAGMDCHEDDLIGGIRGMTAERLMERDRFVFDLARTHGIPLVFNLAGGYQDDVTVNLHVGTIEVALGLKAGAHYLQG